MFFASQNPSCFSVGFSMRFIEVRWGKRVEESIYFTSQNKPFEAWTFSNFLSNYRKLNWSWWNPPIIDLRYHQWNSFHIYICNSLPPWKPTRSTQNGQNGPIWGQLEKTDPLVLRHIWGCFNLIETKSLLIFLPIIVSIAIDKLTMSNK